MITLPRSHLQVPYNRLRISSLKQLELSSGVACTATLRLDGKKAGIVEDSGRGGGPLFHPEPGSAFGHAELDAFAAQCRRDGEPVSTEDVLDDLLTEYELDRLIRRAPAGGTALRLIHSSGYISELCTLSVTPAGEQQRQQAAAKAGDPGAGNRWEIWAGQAWEPIGPPTT